MVIAANGTVLAWNARTTYMLDLPARLLSRNPKVEQIEAYQWETGEFNSASAELRTAIRAGELMKLPRLTEWTRPNGRVLEIRSTAMPDGGIVRTYSDVTERQRAEERAAAAPDQAEAARVIAEKVDQPKTEFLANMSHEIRTRMNGVIGMNDLLLRSNLLGEQGECATGIGELANAMTEVINDILDISKLEAGKVELQLAYFYLGDAVRAAVGVLSPKAAEKQLSLSRTVKDMAHRPVHGDSVRLRQILLNLIGNAVNFTEHGGVQIRVLQYSADSALIRIDIADIGIGKGTGPRSRLLQESAQADSSITCRVGGSGLGLAISWGLAKLMRGQFGGEHQRTRECIPLGIAAAERCA